MKVLHKKRVLAFTKVCSSPLSKAHGLMFSFPLKPKQGIMLSSDKEDLNTIHMFFVFFSIDAIWLDKSKRVIHVVRGIKPFTILVKPPRLAQYIIELPKNSTRGIKIGDKLFFKE